MFTIKYLSGDQYRNFIPFAIRKSDYFILVKRMKEDVTENVALLLQRLSPCFIRMEYQNEWPTTVLYGRNAYAEVYYFKATDEAGAVLLEFAMDMFDWKQPELLTDLCFFVDDTCWLTNKVFTKELYFEHLSESEKTEIRGFGIHLKTVWDVRYDQESGEDVFSRVKNKYRW